MEKLYRQAKHLNVSRSAVKQFLAGQLAYTLHRPARKHYARLKTIVGGPNRQWQADLVDMGSLASANKGVRYLLTVIDCFSRYAWASPVRQKSGPIMAGVLDTLLKKVKPKTPTILQTDKGKEFFNAHVKTVLEKHGVTRHFATHSDTKAAIVERFNRTLRQNMWTYFTAKTTHKWLDVLPRLVSAYNKTYHRAIKQAPTALHFADSTAIAKSWGAQYGQYMANAPRPSRIQGQVRISKQKATFEKGYLPNWTQEVFTVKKQRAGPGRRVYKLEDQTNEPITGVFYQEEVQPLEDSPGDKEYQIEKILKRKKEKNTGKTLWFIKWYGWPEKFNSWIDSKEVKQGDGK